MEARYVKAASRFFLAGNTSGADSRHFLDACFLCKRDIALDRHIFMYRGDAAFCSDDCRQDQMDMDAALKAALKATRRRRRASSSSSPAAACATNKVAAASNNPATVTTARRPTVANLVAHHAHPIVSG